MDAPNCPCYQLSYSPCVLYIYKLVPKSKCSTGTTKVTLKRSMDFGYFVPIFALNTLQKGKESFV